MNARDVVATAGRQDRQAFKVVDTHPVQQPSGRNAAEALPELRAIGPSYGSCRTRAGQQ